jgi:NhaP-type Na+/H+ or K+/H+ antiporter
VFEAPSIVYAAAGVAVFAAAVLPRILRRAPISMPMVFLAAGALAFGLLDVLPTPDPVEHQQFTMHLTEVCVIISLMGAGLALDRPMGWRRWATTWRMIGVAMPLCIIALTLLGQWLLGLGLAGALLLASALAPTDPVLAAEVQVGEPAGEEEKMGQEDEIRFGLTSEAGLNDGLAFPFVYLAIALSVAGSGSGAWFPEWIAIDVLWRIGVGVLVGWGTGKFLAAVFFTSRLKAVRLAEHAEGFVALAATFLAYGTAEMLQGYGFIAVFICAATIRAAERTHGYHRVLHSYIKQLERLMTVIVLVLFGGAIARGLFAGIGWPDVIVASAFLLLVRPLSGWIALSGGKTGPWERTALAFFGIRGIGSFYYLAYALEAGAFVGQAQHLWAVLGLVVAMSVVLHGATASPLMNRLDELRRREAVRRFGDGNQAPKTSI